MSNQKCSYTVKNDAERYILAAFKGSNDTLDWIDHDLRSTPFKYRRKCVVDRAAGATLRESCHSNFGPSKKMYTSVVYTNQLTNQPYAQWDNNSRPRAPRALHLLGRPRGPRHGRLAGGARAGTPGLLSLHNGP